MKKIFISYAHKDRLLKEQFETHLSGLKRQNIIDIWTDRDVIIGEKWNDKIKQKLLTSDIVIFLISSDFLASEYINEVEINETIARHKKGEVLIAPVFLRPCDFESSLLSGFQGVPRDALFISTSDNIDSSFLLVIKELKQLISEFSPSEKPTVLSSVSIKSDIPDCDTPPDIGKWVGRDEELQLLDSLHFKVIFITGIGGQGKSSLATRYVYNHIDSGKYERWDWRDFKEEENRLKTKIIEIIHRFSGADPSIMGLKDASYEELANIFFKTIGDTRILFVFDNIDSYIDYEKFQPVEGFKQLIQCALNRKHNCKFIFTCRPFIKKADVGFYQIELPGLKYSPAVALLDKYSINLKSSQKQDLFKRLHEITKGHPLWLNLLGAQSVGGIDKLEKFIENITGHTNFNEDNINNILSEEIIGALWESLNNKQKNLLRYLTELLKSEGLEGLSKMVEDELNYNQFVKALNRLKLLNLVVTKTKSNDAEEIELHPLVKTYIKSKYPTNERSKYISIIINYYDRVTYILKKRLSGNESLSFYENWTNKVELAINKRDFGLALSSLEEITESILTAGYFEEYFRIAHLLLQKIDFEKTYQNEVPYFISTVVNFVELSSEINEFKAARTVLDEFKKTIIGKGRDYVVYCKLECIYHWSRFDNPEAIRWGEKAMSLIKSGNVEDHSNIEHTLNLAKRDSRNEVLVRESLDYFMKGRKIEDLIDKRIDRSLPAHYYGNLGRSYYLINDIHRALILYLKAFTLTYEEEIASRYLNRGFASYWIAQLLQKKEDFKSSYLFYSNCLHYWKNHSPHRASRAEDEFKVLKRELPDLEDMEKLSNETVEEHCKLFSKRHLNK